MYFLNKYGKISIKKKPVDIWNSVFFEIIVPLHSEVTKK